MPRGRARRDPEDPGHDREPAPEPDVLEGGQVAKGAEPVEAQDPQAEEQEAEPGERREEADDRDQEIWWSKRERRGPVAGRADQPWPQG